MKKKILGRVLSSLLVGVMTASLFTGCSNKKSGSDDATKSYPLNMTAVEATRHMGNGINLGNTMEAYGRVANGTDAATTVYETSWGQPVTTKEMIQGMKDSGFDTIRIPIAWTNMMNYESGDYTINEKLLKRVAELVDWAVEAEMFVIINDHWDGGWWGMFGSATEDTRDEALVMYKEMWTQIATYFKDYSGYLIFESGNEELGDRLNDRDVASDSGSLSEDQCYETTNLINQTFVDVVRSTGSVNAERFLLIAGYNTNIDATIDDRFVMPTDTATDKLMVSVHYYDPWSYCGTEDNAEWGIKSEYNSLNRALSKLSKFTEAGYGVVIGEYGALPTSDGTLKSNTIEFTSAMLDLCTQYDLCPVLWDRGDFYSKKEYKVTDSDLAALYSSNDYDSEKNSSLDDIKAAAETRYATAFEAAATERELVIDYDAIAAEGSHAWIMWSGYKGSYSVGDTYSPDSATGGIVATDVEVTGAGTYTVSLDFTGCDGGSDSGFSFSALGLSNGEILYPGYLIDIKEVLINGEAYTLLGEPYTTADDQICTRVNLYNGWVSQVPDEARSVDGTPADASPTIIGNDLTDIKSIQITFEYIAP